MTATSADDADVFDGDVLAIVYQPKTHELLGVYDDEHAGVVLASGQSVLGTAFLATTADDVDGCARTHVPGVRTVGTGYGLSLYAGLGCLAYSAYGYACIGSSGQPGFEGRTPLADRWWRKAVQSGLAVESAHGEVITLASFIRAGLVFWMAEPDAYEDEVALARREYAGAFASATTDRVIRQRVEGVLEQVLAAEPMRAWRQAHGVIPNRAGGRRKPAFVTPELESAVAQQYAHLEGL